MKAIGMILKLNTPEVQEVLAQLKAWSESNFYQMFFDEESASLLGQSDGLALEELSVKCNPIITLGGDGTLIRVARHAAELDRTIIGVNFGNLGFLTEIAPHELISCLELVIAGKAKLAERTMIKARVMRRGEEVFTSRALNDAVILKSAESSLVDLDIAKDDSEMMRLRTDGLIFSTATGSTAYSLAAGGSIAYPTLSLMLLTPICPHSLTNRPLVMPLDSLYTVTAPEHEGTLHLTMDGQVSIDLEAGDKILLTKASTLLKFARSDSKNYFDILRTKLNWSVGNATRT